ncbi:hypothetical protein PVK06_028552 [Gossypium arboreum]|uniref:RNase H type-1 domain-containing protein n=1 Tax=Gossypium arboreum TaxID=29729 RepID=A0ABR0P3C0_GOSAR|nr:hypothetical protein PVK06_028552 [Gossypium arboreum]
MDQWSIRNVPREKNQVVDHIVKMASDRIEDVHVYFEASEELRTGLCVDKTNGFLTHDGLI